MATLTDYKGLLVVDSASGAGGTALTNDFKELADRAPQLSTSDPADTNDSTEYYFEGSLWFNSDTQTLWICVDATAGSAVWKSVWQRKSDQLNLVSEGDGSVNIDSLQFDGNTISSTDTDGDILLTPDGSGSVGIGASSPNYLLNVGGNPTNVADAAAGFKKSFDQTSSTYATVAVEAEADPSADSTANVIGADYKVSVSSGNTKDLTGTLGVTGFRSKISHNGTGTVTGSAGMLVQDPSLGASSAITNCYGLYISKQKQSGVTNAWGVYQQNSSDDNYFAGSVGIGTDSPTTQLELKAASPRLRISDSSTVSDPSDATAIVDLYYTDNGGTPQAMGYIGFTSSGDANMEIRNALDGDLEFWTDNSTRMVVSADGDVGIGETSPDAKLHVSTGAAANVGVKVETVSGQTADLLQMQDSSENVLVKIDKDGYATVPDLTIERDLPRIYFIETGVTDSNWRQDVNSGVMRFRTLDSSSAIATTPVVIERAPDDTLYVNSDGNVGIGTSSPDATLDVAGEIAITDGVTAPSATSGKAKLYVDSADGDLKIKFGDGTVKVIKAD